MKKPIRIYLGIALYLLTGIPTGVSQGQPVSPASILDRVVSISISRKPLVEVLDSIGEKGHFEFSYNSSIIRGDSLVSITLRRVTIRQLLDRLLGQRYSYTERGHYLIILRATEERAPPAPSENIYQLTGYVVDGQTGEKVVHASVYEKEQLQSALTDEQGFFRLRLKTRYTNPVLMVSKEWYTDTALAIRPGHDQAFTIPISPVPVRELSPVVISRSRVERTKWGRFFLSSRQRIQSLNLSHFFTDKPYQLSLTPGLGTHGGLSGQVINQLSLNIIGGYSAGTRGLEVGGVFNIDKKDVRYLQAAGVFNLVGGKMSGLQAAGVSNAVWDTVVGVQLAGSVNVDKGDMRGVQGAGAVNIVGGNVTGLQAAGAVNIAKGAMSGVQVSTILNRASFLRGVQIGLINRSDTSSGYSIGLVNLVKRGGIRQLSLSAADISGLTLAFKSGTPRLYDILLVGYNPLFSERLASWGFGIGKAFSFGDGWGLTTELTERELYDTHWNDLGPMYRFQPALTFRKNKWVSLYVGPTFSLHAYPRDMPGSVSKPDMPGPGFPAASWGGRSSAWIGASIGVDFF